jgi:hypothetical protein
LCRKSVFRGKTKSSKLFAKEYFKFELKNKFSLIIISVSFSTKSAPLKNSSLDAINGLKRILVPELNLLEVSLSYMVLALLLNSSSISVSAFKFAIFISFLTFFLIPASLEAWAIIPSTTFKSG